MAFKRSPDIEKTSLLQLEKEIETLRRSLWGELLQIGDDGYDASRRVWNGNIDRHPALIVRCRGVSDVRCAVDFARTHGLLLSVRGGGHSFSGHGTNDGGLVIDLSLMRGIRVDPLSRTARCEAGVLWGELDRETQAFGLATTGGTVSDTGIAGLTLGGGFGWLMGKHGLTVDNLVSADVVTADGRFMPASETDNPDLFWALRGGGGNFGIVTPFEYRLHPVNEVLGGMVLWPLDQAREVLRFYREFCSTLPDEAEAYAAFLTTDDGVPALALMLGYNGSIAEGEAFFQPMRSFGKPLADLLKPMPYTERQSLLDENGSRHGLQRYVRAAFTEHLSDDLIDLVVEAAANFSSPLSALVFFYMHGAVTRVAPSATAYAARRLQWDFNVFGQWIEGKESPRHIAWVRSLWSRLEPHLMGRVYINHLTAEAHPETVRASYGENYAGLRRIKALYDPTNLFRLNANVPPSD